MTIPLARRDPTVQAQPYLLAEILMALEDLETIDIVLQPDADGKVGLAIIDAGITVDPQRRNQLFQEKVRPYFGAVVQGQFQ